MLRDGIPTQAVAHDVTGYTGFELDEVGKQVAQLRKMRRLAIMRYLRPWMIKAIDQELDHTHDTSTWLYHLRLALSEISSNMTPPRKMVDRRASLVYSVEI